MSIEEHGPVQETLLPRQQFGRYEIVGLLGSGGFAAVYEALDPALDATVAVKVLGDNHCVDPDVRARFIKEARLLRRVGTDRLVPVFDIGEQSGQPYFVMELIRGGTLADRLAEGGVRSGPLQRTTVRRIVIELAECLDAVHQAGIVHRDLKPSNILIRRLGGPARPNPASGLLEDDEQLVLGDFGIAREVDASNLTMAVGTVGYMAPEQQTPSATIDQRADLYAATATVAMLLTSVGTVAGNDPGDMAAEPNLLSPELRAALARGLAADPADRPSTAGEWQAMMLHALPVDESSTRHLGPPGPGPNLGHNPPPADRPASPSASSPARPGAKWPAAKFPPSKLTMAILAALVVVAIGGASLIMAVANGEPRIVGPDTVRVGGSVTYRAETSPGAEYYWVDWNGVRHDQEALRVQPSGAGVLPITLTQVVDGQQRTEKLVIKVVE